MTVLDVGQGQSIILQSEGKTYLVDCGGSYDDTAANIAAHKLLSQGIARLDGVILTHFDADHSGGVDYLLSRIPAERIPQRSRFSRIPFRGRAAPREPVRISPQRSVHFFFDLPQGLPAVIPVLRIHAHF
jgi:beta-lactamase superfamily II metal-dependent hydrolase